MTISIKQLLIIGGGVVALVLVVTLAIIFGPRLFASGPAPSATLSGASTLPAGGSTSGTPEPRILVIDRGAILRQSVAGKDMIAQIDALTKAAEADFKGEDQKLRNDVAAFQQQMAVLAPEVRAQKTRELEARQQDLQRKVQERQGQIQAGVAKARQDIENALGPILEAIMTERGGNLLLDRNAIVLGTVNVDITGTAIQRLDQKLTKVKVELVNPPAGGQDTGTQ